jgi:hypothetical protein
VPWAEEGASQSSGDPFGAFSPRDSLNDGDGPGELDRPTSLNSATSNEDQESKQPLLSPDTLAEKHRRVQEKLNSAKRRTF